MRRIFLLLPVLALLLGGCSGEGPVNACELKMWVTTQENARIYQELAEKWNEENPDELICLTVEVYSSQRIAGKLDRMASIGTSFSDDDFPDLVEIDYATFPRYVFQQTTDLYPLKSMLDKNMGGSAELPGAALYSHNEICFALPYRDQELVLCYRLDLEKELSNFRARAHSFEGIAKMGREYAAQNGEPLLMVDYLGSETFLALFAQALQETNDSLLANDAAEAWLKEMEQSGASEYLPSGDAYADAFQELMRKGEITCVVTTQANLRRLAQGDETIGQRYGVLPLPSFRGERCSVSAPTVGAAISMSGEHVILARDFLEFCRFSQAAREYAMFNLCHPGQGIEENLSPFYQVSGDFDAPAAPRLTAAMVEAFLSGYSDDILALEDAG